MNKNESGIEKKSVARLITKRKLDIINELSGTALNQVLDIIHRVIDESCTAYDALEISADIMMMHILNIYSLTNGRDATYQHFVEDMKGLAEFKLEQMRKNEHLY